MIREDRIGYSEKDRIGCDKKWYDVRPYEMVWHDLAWHVQ